MKEMNVRFERKLFIVSYLVVFGANQKRSVMLVDAEDEQDAQKVLIEWIACLEFPPDTFAFGVVVELAQEDCFLSPTLSRSGKGDIKVNYDGALKAPSDLGDE